MAPAGFPPERTPEINLHVDAARVRGTWRRPSRSVDVAIDVDGELRAILAGDPGGFTWEIPAHVFGRLLDIRSVPAGVSLLSAPLDFSAVRQVRWGQWTITADRVGGSFQADGNAAALPVALWAGSVRHAHGFARQEGTGYVFDLPLDRLPSGLDDVALQPSVGGLLLSQTLHLPPGVLTHIGLVEPSEPWRVRGWVVQQREPGRQVALELYLDGCLAKQFVAERRREDVSLAGFGNGFNGFDIAVAAPLDRPVTIDVRVARGPSLANSPYLRPAAPRYLGCFDRVDEFSASGWAMDLAQLDEPMRVEARCDGAVIGSGLTSLHRGDVAEAGLPIARCGFHVSLSRPANGLIGRDIAVTIAGTDLALQGSPRRITVNRNAAAFLERRRPADATLTRLRQRLTRRVRDVTVSIVMPVYDTPSEWLLSAIGSVVGQWSDNWELICVDDGSTAAEVGVLLRDAARDPRIRLVLREENGGIARAVNAGLLAARGDYVAFLDHDDALEPDAIYHLARAIQETGAGLIYSDEILTGPSLDEVLQHRARPAWSRDYYLSHPYFVHLVAVRRELALRIGGYDERLRISADVDFVLRAAERALEHGGIVHVPRVLYRWRTHPESAGHGRRDEVMAATQGAIERHLMRAGRPARVSAGAGFNQFRLDWPDDGGEVLIVIPTKDRIDLLRQCIDSIEATAASERFRIVVVDHQSTDPATIDYLRRLRHTVLPYAGGFNYPAINNFAVRTLGGTAEYLLFLNNDVEAIEPGWLGRLRSLAGRAEVGAVGPLLLYGNGQVQHAGVIVGFQGTADHAMRFVEPTMPDGSRNTGYNMNLTSVRDYSAVTAACLMMRRTIFEQVGGFDEAFPVGFNDTDLCLRLRAAGLKVLYDGQTMLRHHESATRARIAALADPPEDGRRFRQRWAAFIQDGDPFYHPVLAISGMDHRLREDTIRANSLKPRVSR